LIGFNYSLLGNFPAEPIFAAPDYFVTILFKRLMGNAVLQVGLQSTEPSSLRVYAFCSSQYDGGVAVALVNFDEHRNSSASLSLPGRWEEYLLSPAWFGDDDAPARSKATSRHVQLNGRLLKLGSNGELPDFSAVRHPSAASLTVPPLQLAFAVFPEAKASACSKSVYYV